MELSIHYTTKMVANAESFSPSAGKPAQVMDSWASLGLPLNIVEPLPVSVDQLWFRQQASKRGDITSLHQRGDVVCRP